MLQSYGLLHVLKYYRESHQQVYYYCLLYCLLLSLLYCYLNFIILDYKQNVNVLFWLNFLTTRTMRLQHVQLCFNNRLMPVYM